MYYRIYCFGVYLSDDPLNNIKPSVTFYFLFFSIILEFWNWYNLITNTKSYIKSPLFIVISGVIILLLLDYFIFIKNKRWRLEAKKFKEFSKRQTRNYDMVVVLVIVLILGSSVISMHFLEKANLRGR
jgi:uncharacterized membrane protein YwzB